MTRPKLFISTIFLSISVFAKAQSRLAGFHNVIGDFTQKYAPDFKPLVKYRDWDEKMFISDGKPFIDGLPTYFHERLHLLNDSLTNVSEKSTSRFYFFDGHITEILKVPVFKTVVIDGLVPNELKTGISRYNLYINGRPKRDGVLFNPDTKENGVYGLLEEFIAYYYSNTTYAKIYDEMKIHYSYDQNVWFEYLGTRSNFVNTYYEFRLFIGYYFLYCKKHDPDMYHALINNMALMNLISTSDKKFKGVIDNYWQVRNEILKKSKNMLMARNGFLISKESNERYQLPDNQMLMLKNAYTPEIVAAMGIN